jgi:predicted site-specific integrase-resolvase
MTLKELAYSKGVDYRTVRRWFKAGRIVRDPQDMRQRGFNVLICPHVEIESSR